MKFVRFGGLGGAKQDRNNAPSKKGIWAFPDGLIDTFYLSGTDKLDYKKNPAHKPRTFEYKGDIWLKSDDVPQRFLKYVINFTENERALWCKLPYEIFYKIYKKRIAMHGKLVYSDFFNDYFPMNAGFEVFIDIKDFKRG